MAKVLGVGGVFFKAEDPKAVADWYARVFGMPAEEWGGVAFPPLPYGVTVWSPFKADTKYMEPSTQPFMINLMVDDLDEVLAKALSEGVEAVGRDDSDPNGRFAWVMDPVGVKIELWEPKADLPPPP